MQQTERNLVKITTHGEQKAPSDRSIRLAPHVAVGLTAILSAATLWGFLLGDVAMSASKHNWKSIENEKEKYAAYLCSREWAEKREAVKKRAMGRCERCKVLDMDSCHHLTYERKYAEKLSDLQAICTPCHEFTHGKSDFDPKLNFKFLFYLKAVTFEKGKKPVGWEFMIGLTPEMFSNAAVPAVMMLCDMSDVAASCSFDHETLGHFHDEIEHGTECNQSVAFNDCARLIQDTFLDIDLMNWLAFRRPYCDSFEDYTKALSLLGFSP